MFSKVPEVFLQPALGEPMWFPPIEDKVLDVPEISEVGEEGVKGIRVDPFSLWSTALTHGQGARVNCRAGLTNWHNSLPPAMGEKDHIFV